MRKIFVDTNILPDVVMHRSDFHVQSAMVWADCENRKVRGFVSAVSLNHMHHVMRKRVEPSVAPEYVRLVLNVFSVAAAGRSDSASGGRSSPPGFRRCHPDLFSRSGQGRLHRHPRAAALPGQLHAGGFSR